MTNPAILAREENAKRAIIAGRLTDAEIRRVFGLSEVAFGQLAGLVRKGCVA